GVAGQPVRSHVAWWKRSVMGGTSAARSRLRRADAAEAEAAAAVVRRPTAAVAALRQADPPDPAAAPPAAGAGGEPVAAPLPDVAGHVVQAERRHPQPLVDVRRRQRLRRVRRPRAVLRRT